MKIYVASSWRNERVTNVISALRFAGHEVYDFREDTDDGAAFNWSDIDPNWQKWTPEEFRRVLYHNGRAANGFYRDLTALRACDAVVLVMPCGRSAHLELGFAVGAGKFTLILLSSGEPELCYKMVDALCLDVPDVLKMLDQKRSDVDALFAREAKPITKVRPT